MRLRAIILALSWAILGPFSLADHHEAFHFDQEPGEVIVELGESPVATFVYKDDEISRPYFAHVKTPSGIQVTRNHPPIEGKDISDHGTYHPGIWLSFGDVGGSDYWRLRAPVRQSKFVKNPEGYGFTVTNEYLDQEDNSQVVCEEVASYTFKPHPLGYLILWDSTFTSDQDFYFGDQEEMGLGIRVATPIRAEPEEDGDIPAGQGEITDSEGRVNEEEIWSNAADWADYSGELDNKLVGMTILCHPDNFRPSWFHARDYGLLEANPFGREAFGKGTKSKVIIKPGEELRLRYGILVHESDPDETPDIAAAYQDYLQLTDAR